MMARQTVMIGVLATLATMIIVLAAGCDREDSAGKQDQPTIDKGETPTTKEASTMPTSGPSEAGYVRVPLGEIKVPEGTPDGEWLEIGGHTPLLWCYRGGKHLVFEQAGPKVYLSIDSKPFVLTGIIVRSREEMLLIDALAKKSDHGLAVWVYSPHLRHIRDVTALSSVDSIHVWDWGRGLLADLSPLAAARDLTSLCVRDCHKLTDLSPLRKMVELSSLDLRGTGVMGIKPLATLPLVWLDIRSTKLAPPSLPSLAGLRRLRALNVDAYAPTGAAMPLTRVVPKLADLERLTVTYATKRGQEGRPFVALGAPPKLSSLILDGLGGEPDLSSVASLKGLTNLQLLGYLKTGVGLGPLSSLQALKALRVEVRMAVIPERADSLPGTLDLTPLLKLKQLTSLEIICEAATKGHERIGELPNLTNIVLQTCFMLAIPRFAHPEKLVSADFSSPQFRESNHLEDISTVSTATNLKKLSLRNCRGVKDIAALGTLRKLRYLDLDHNGPTTLAPLNTMTDLEVLRLKDYNPHFYWGDDGKVHRVFDALSPLAKLQNLRELDLSQSRSGNEIAALDLRPIAKLKRLERLELDLAAAKNLSLVSLPSLTSASLPWNMTTETFNRFVRGHPRLRRLRVRSGRAFEPLKADLSHVRELAHLHEVEVDLKSFGSLKDLTLLTYVQIWAYQTPADFDSLAGLTSLRYMRLYTITTAKDTSVPPGLGNLFRVFPGLAGKRGKVSIPKPLAERGILLEPVVKQRYQAPARRDKSGPKP